MSALPRPGRSATGGGGPGAGQAEPARPPPTPAPEALAWRRDWSVPAKGDGCFPALSGLERPLVGMEMVEQGMVGASPSGEPRRGLIWRTER